MNILKYIEHLEHCWTRRKINYLLVFLQILYCWTSMKKKIIYLYFFFNTKTVLTPIMENCASNRDLKRKNNKHHYLYLSPFIVSRNYRMVLNMQKSEIYLLPALLLYGRSVSWFIFLFYLWLGAHSLTRSAKTLIHPNVANWKEQELPHREEHSEHIVYWRRCYYITSKKWPGVAHNVMLYVSIWLLSK